MDWIICVALFVLFLFLNVRACAWVEQRFNRSLRLSGGAKFYGFFGLAVMVCVGLALFLVPPSNGPYSYLATGIAAGVAHVVALALCGHKVTKVSRVDA